MPRLDQLDDAASPFVAPRVEQLSLGGSTPAPVAPAAPQVVDRQAYWQEQRQMQEEQQQRRQAAIEAARQQALRFDAYREAAGRLADQMSGGALGRVQGLRAQASKEELYRNVNVADYGSEGEAIAEARRRSAYLPDVRVRYPGEDQTVGQGFREFAGEAGGVARQVNEGIAQFTRPVMQPVRRAVGDAAQYLAERQLATMASPGAGGFGGSIGGATTEQQRQTSGTVAKSVAGAIVPVEPWEIALELLPGIGTVPGVASFGKTAIRKMLAEEGLPATRAGVRALIEKRTPGGVKATLTKFADESGMAKIPGTPDLPEPKPGAALDKNVIPAAEREYLRLRNDPSRINEALRAQETAMRADPQGFYDRARVRMLRGDATQGELAQAQMAIINADPASATKFAEENQLLAMLEQADPMKRAAVSELADMAAAQHLTQDEWLVGLRRLSAARSGADVQGGLLASPVPPKPGAEGAAGGLPASAAGAPPPRAALPSGEAAPPTGGSLTVSDSSVPAEIRALVEVEPPRYVDGEWLDPPDLGVARSGRARLLPFAQSLEDAATRVPTTPGTVIAKGLAKIPGAKGVIGLINRAALINADPQQGLVTLYRRILNQGEQGVHYGMDAYMRDKPFPFDLKGGIARNLPKGSRFGPKATTSLVPPGTKVSGFEGENIFDILERATRQDIGKHVTQEQFDWITTTRTLIDDAVDDLLAARKIAPGSKEADAYRNRLGFGPGEHYFPRLVFGREGVEGSRRASRAGGGIGANKFFDRSRIHQYAAEGAGRGLDYDDPRIAMETFLMAIRRQTADEYLLQFARDVGRTRKQLGVGKDTFLGAYSGQAWGREGTIPLREGSLPGLRGHFFPAEIIETVEKQLTDEGSSALRKLDELTGKMRTAKAGFDAGAPLIQGLPLLARNQVIWGRATFRHFAVFADPAVRSRYLQAKRGMIQEYLDWGGELTTPEFFDAARQGGLLAKAVKRPAAAMDTFLDVGRIEMWEALSKGANDVDKPGYMGIVRNLLGTTSPDVAGTAKGVTQAERIALWFSTRLTKSPVAMAGHLLGTRKNAQEAARTLAQFAGGVSLVMYGLAKGSGMSDEEIGEMFNPNSGRKFMSVRAGKNYIGIGGTYRSLAQLAGMSYEAARNDPEAFVSGNFERNPMLRWFRSRTTQLTGTAITLGTGFDYAGRSVDDWGDRLKVMAENFSPFSVDAVIEAEGDPWEKMAAGGASAVGLRQVKLSSSNWLDIMRDREASRLGYTDYAAMQKQLGTPAAVAELNKNPEVKRWYDATKRDGQLRREERGELSLTDVLQPFRDEQAAADADPELEDPQTWISNRRARTNRRAGAISLWQRDNPEDAKRLQEEGKNLDPYALAEGVTPDQIRAAYFKVFNSHTTATGGVDDQDKLSDDIDRFNGGLTDAQRAVLDANIGLNSTPREKQYSAAMRQLGDAGYFDRRDEAFTFWRNFVVESPRSDPAFVEAARGWDEPADLEAYVKQRLKDRGFAPEYFNRDPIWKGWENTYEQRNGRYLVADPVSDANAVEWGYQSRVHSPEAAKLYEDRTGLKAPIPSQ